MAIQKERIEYFALLAEIVGALGVIISVVYLAVQVGDGNKELRAQNHHDSLSLAQRSMEMLITDKEIAALYLAGKELPNNLSEVDNVRLEYFYFLTLNAWEFSYYQNKDGAVPPELWIGQDGWMRSEIRTSPALRAAWVTLQSSFAEPFRSYANELMELSGL